MSVKSPAGYNLVNTMNTTMTDKTVYTFQADEVKRIFTLNGRRIPSVSDVLRDAGLSPKWSSEDAMTRGSYVHALCEYLDLGDYDQSEADRLGLAGYVESWRKTKIKENIEIVDIEKRRFNSTFGFCGKTDRIVMIGETAYDHILDLKTGGHYDYIRIQLGAYAYLQDNPPDAYGRCSVHLHEDGSAGDVEFYDDESDCEIFLSMLATTNTRLKHGVIKWGNNGLESDR